MLDRLLSLVRQRPSSATGEDGGQGYVREEYLVNEIRDLRDSALRVRTDEEKEWLRAWNFYKGRHWITWREDRWVEIEANDKPKVSVNFIQHVVQTRLGHLIKNRPMLIAAPANSDEESRNAAKLGLKVLEAYHHKLRLQKKYKDAILHMAVTGKSYLQPGWDPFAGGTWERPDPATGQMLRGPLGELTVDVRRIHEVLPEPGTKDLDDTQRLIVRTFLPLAQLRRMFGTEKTKDLQPIDPSTREGSGMLRALYGFEGAIPSAVHNRVEVCEVFYRRGVDRAEGGQYEEGLRVVVAGDKVLAASGTMPGFAEIPLIELSDVENDTFYPTSVARGLLDLNKIVDVELSQQEYNRKVLRPKTLMPVQAYVAKEAWDKTDDEVVEYYAPYKPEPYTPPSLPAHHLELRNAIITLLKELGGNFDVMSGNAQSDVRSGRMVAYLQEYAGTVLGVTAQNIEESFERLGNQMADLIKEYVREDRLLPLVGRNRRMEVVSFKGGDLKAMGTLMVQPDSALPTSRAEKYDRIERWMEKQFIPPDQGMKMLNAVDPDTDLYAMEEANREIADEAIYKLKRLTPESLADVEKRAMMKMAEDRAAKMAVGIEAVTDEGAKERAMLRALGVEAFEFEQHAVIIDQVDRSFRLTAAYRASPPALRSLTDAYVDWHSMFAAGIDPDLPMGSPAALAEAAAMAAPQQPGPDGRPQPAPGAPSPTDGSPVALHPGQAQAGPGGVGGNTTARESGPETANGLPPVRPAPGPMHAGR